MYNKKSPPSARQDIIDSLLENLKKGKIPWEKEWDASIGLPYNAVTNRPYSNKRNQFILFLAGMNKGYDDPRWATYNQIESKNWYVNKGEKSTRISVYGYYEVESKKWYTISEFEQLAKDNPDLDISKFKFREKVFNVFNAKQITGIPELEKRQTIPDFEMDSAIQEIIENVKVGYREQGNQAYYSLSQDTITMPPKTSFKSQSGYHSTLLHELSHSTMHESRMNRKEGIGGEFGTPSYAKEELRAEIGSALLSAELGVMTSDRQVENHAAYIQSWIKILEESPEELFKAIDDATKISDYILDNCSIYKTRELHAPDLSEESLVIKETKEVKEEKKPKSIKDQIASANKRLSSEHKQEAKERKLSDKTL